MSNCSKHGFYLNVNGCPDCNQPRTDAFVEAIDRLKDREKKTSVTR